MYIMLRLCEHGMVDRIITLQWPASSVCILSLSIDCGSPFFCCEDNSTKPYTQIHTNCRQGKEHEDQTDNTSARPL